MIKSIDLGKLSLQWVIKKVIKSIEFRKLSLRRVIPVTSSIGILTHQGHKSQVNENADSVSQKVTLITSIASCDTKKKEQIYF